MMIDQEELIRREVVGRQRYLRLQHQFKKCLDMDRFEGFRYSYNSSDWYDKIVEGGLAKFFTRAGISLSKDREVKVNGFESNPLALKLNEQGKLVRRLFRKRFWFSFKIADFHRIGSDVITDYEKEVFAVAKKLEDNCRRDIMSRIEEINDKRMKTGKWDLRFAANLFYLSYGEIDKKDGWRFDFREMDNLDHTHYSFFANDQIWQQICRKAEKLLAEYDIFCGRITRRQERIRRMLNEDFDKRVMICKLKGG